MSSKLLGQLVERDICRRGRRTRLRTSIAACGVRWVVIAPRSDGRAAGLPIGPEGAVVVGDRTDTEDVESVAPLTGLVLGEDRAGAFVEALDLDLRDGCGGGSHHPHHRPSSAAGSLLGAGLADDGVEEEATGTGATDGASGPRTTPAQLARSPGVCGLCGPERGRGNANRGNDRCAALDHLDHNRMHVQSFQTPKFCRKSWAYHHHGDYQRKTGGL